MRTPIHSAVGHVATFKVNEMYFAHMDKLSAALKVIVRGLLDARVDVVFPKVRTVPSGTYSASPTSGVRLLRNLNLAKQLLSQGMPRFSNTASITSCSSTCFSSQLEIKKNYQSLNMWVCLQEVRERVFNLHSKLLISHKLAL